MVYNGAQHSDYQLISMSVNCCPTNHLPCANMITSNVEKSLVDLILGKTVEIDQMRIRIEGYRLI
jgi:hypothetical protein